MPENHAAPAGQAAECQVCPVCAGLAALRGARPETVEHLVKAGAELLLAAKALLDGAAAPEAEPAPGRRRARPSGPGGAAGNGGLQRIDVG
jgi:hypothetical protein